MQKVIIIGAGARAAEIEEYIFENNKLNPAIELFGFLDDSRENHQKPQLKLPLLGSIFTYDVPKKVELILAINNLTFSSKIINHFSLKNTKFTNFIHHKSRVFKTAKIGVGNIFCPYTQIGFNVDVRNFNAFNNKTS
ncbi:hypothetical protein [Flavobacterium sp.]|uniref:PglD-related sugar-binding protein n=1 Tax=Flavobacterium sp. TaxID=239 RepID=UPI00286CDE6A|nr:hypothetical protein [Flavobacterium sp.]